MVETKLYTPLTAINDEYAIVDLKDGSGKINDFFVYDRGDDKFLNHTRPTLLAQSGLTPNNIHETDFLLATVSIPVFSKNFKEKLEATLANEIAFYLCDVIVQEKAYEFCIGKILKTVELINKSESQHRKLSDGSLILSKLIYNEKFRESFYIARDFENKYIYEVTEEFRKLVEKNKLRMNFLKR